MPDKDRRCQRCPNTRKYDDVYCGACRATVDAHEEQDRREQAFDDLFDRVDALEYAVNTLTENINRLGADLYEIRYSLSQDR